MLQIQGARAVINMFLGSMLGGIVLCVIGVLIGAAVLRGELAGFGALAGGLIGGTIGFPLGVIGSMVLLHRFLHYNGSLWYGILGSIVGIVLVVGLSEPLNLNSNMNIVLVCLILTPTVLGTAGYFTGSKIGKKDKSSREIHV